MNATPRGGITCALYGMCISLKRSSTYGLLSQLRKHLMLTLYSAASSDFVLDLQFMTAGIVGVYCKLLCLEQSFRLLHGILTQ